jgi:iron complex outermembrane receptor protein
VSRLCRAAITLSLNPPNLDRAIPREVSLAKFIGGRVVLNVLASVLIAVALLNQVLVAIPQEEGNTREPLKQMSLEQLANIEVTTVSKRPEELRRTPAAIYVLTHEDIRRSGATSIPEALRLVPGVQVARIDSNTWSIGVRGFGSRFSRNVLVLIDGRSVYSPLLGGVYWEVQDTLLEDVDRIEVIRGPGGTIWGADAVNAVINIITKPAQDTRGTLVSLGGGNVDQGTIGFRYGARTAQGFNYRVYGKGFTRGPEFHQDHRNFDDWRMGQSGFRADSGSNRVTFEVQRDLYSGEAGQRVTVAGYLPPFSTNVQQNTELSGGNLLGRWRRVLGAGSDIEVVAYYDRTYRREADYEDRRSRFDIDFTHHFRMNHGQDFIWGFEARRGSAFDPQVISTVAFSPSHTSGNFYSGFAQDEISFADNRLSLTIGSKFWHSGSIGFEAEPSLRFLWTPNSQQSLWAAVTRAVATPSRVERGLQVTGLLATNPLTYLRIIGDGNFSSEQLIGYEAGYRTLLRPNIYLDIAAFHNDYNSLESVEPGTPFQETTPGTPHIILPYYFRNGLRGSTDGIELAPDWKPFSWWELKGSYSYLHMHVEKKPGSLDPGTAAGIRGSSPQHQVVIQSFLNLPRNLEFDQTYRYVSALPAQLVASYGTADARFGWSPNPHIELSLVGDNLLQPRHAEYAGDPGPLVQIKRSAYGKITLRW